MNRRKFIQSTMATTLLASLDSYAKPVFTEGSASDLKIMATNWGFDGNSESFCKKAKAAGYDGIEVWWETDAIKRRELFNALIDYELAVGFLVGSSSGNATKYLEDFFKDMVNAATQTILKPLYINCHSGKDFFTSEQAKNFFNASKNTSKNTGVPIYHETHRGRLLYSAPITRGYLEAHPDLELTLDISHWCCVHESLLADQEETVNLALSRTGHIHARVGHPEGPQVSDPRAPEWDKAVKAHFAWWDKVVERRRKEGKQITILTEFGPPNYMPTLPYTREPVANQWDINAYMMKVLRERYK
jgi:sugar phosphate isomerase/epimerase